MNKKEREFLLALAGIAVLGYLVKKHPHMDARDIRRIYRRSIEKAGVTTTDRAAACSCGDCEMCLERYMTEAEAEVDEMLSGMIVYDDLQ